MSEPILELRGASKTFPVRTGPIGPSRSLRAVDRIDLQLERGRTTSIVGESGCGKTTTMRMLLGIEEPSEGTVLYRGMELREAPTAIIRQYRRSISAVFQDPSGSLDPRQRIGWSLLEPLRIHRSEASRIGADVESEAAQLLELVGLRTADLARYPHEFSGGQRQRIAIARALFAQPDLVVLDEPVSALDVSVRGQILNLLMDFQQQRGIGYVMVTHDLATVWFISDVVVVMYLGRIVESGPAEEVRRHPAHPYTRMLLDAAPTLQTASISPEPIRGEVASPIDPPSGCSFHPRCPRASARCAKETPELSVADGAHRVACHHPLADAG